MSNVEQKPETFPDAIIPAGKAREILLAALANYTAASSRLIELSDAMARALDETSSKS